MTEQSISRQTIRDITDRYRAEEEQRESEERLRILLEKAPEAIIIFDTDKGIITQVNENTEHLFGISREMILGRPNEVLDTWIQKKENLVNDCIKGTKSTLSGIKRIHELDIRQQGADEIRTCEIRCIQIPYRDIRLVRMSLIDITERKKAEEKIRRGVQMIAKNQETLAILNDQIRNPLTILMIASEGVEPEMAEIMHQAIKKIDDIITMLDQGWIESDKVRSVMKKHYNLSDEELS